MTERIDVVKLLIENDDGEFVMLKKSSDYDWMGDKWEQPGSKIESGEDRFDAAIREVKEETGLNLENVEDLVRLEIEDEKLVNCYVMYADEFSGDVSIDQEHQDFQWVSREEAIKLDWHRDASYIIPVIRYLEAYRDSVKDYGSGEEVDVVKLLIQNEEGKFLEEYRDMNWHQDAGYGYPPMKFLDDYIDSPK